MTLPVTERVTLVEILELTGPFETFAAALQDAVRRLEVEGVSGLVGVQFYATPRSNQVGGILTFADPGQFMDHVRMVTGWPEFKALVSLVKPLEMRVHGKLSDEALATLGKMIPLSRVFERPVAGFVR